MTSDTYELSDQFEVSLPLNPYPGLRPFEKHEWPIFFGREKMVDDVIDRLVRQHFLVVHGDSGCGKSSLVRAGVLARLEQENARSGLTWRTCVTQPREAPMELLAESLCALDGRAGDAERIIQIRRVLNFGADAPKALSQMLRRGPTDHICILIDQFEELFAFVRRHGREEARLLVQCLVGLLHEPPPGLYMILTMRSEFLGVCAQFPGLAEAVNEAQYLLPKMAHADLIRAIREPASLYSGHVSLELAQRLITDSGGTQDELPLIQHGLMLLHRTETAPAGNGGVTLAPVDATPTDPGDVKAWRLELRDYDASTGLAQLLSTHADEVCDVADPPPGRVAQKLFRALTETNAEGLAIRHPQTFGKLIDVTGTDEATLRRVIDTFRDHSASFLTPYGDEPLAPTALVDISHEALIRSWRRIADPKEGWLAREFQDGLVWKSLLVQAASFERNRSNVLSPAAAEERREWLMLHNPAWAERYGGGWDRVTQFVDASVDAGRAAKRIEEAKTRRQMMLVVTIAVLLAAFSAFAIWQNRITSRARDQAYRASADSLWNRLIFLEDDRISSDELKALWEITAGNQRVKGLFVDELTTDSDRAIRLGRRPDPVVRAIALRWPDDRIRAAFEHAVGAVVSRTDAGQLGELASTVTALAAKLTSEQVSAVVPNVLKALESSTVAEQRAALGAAIRIVAPKLTGTQADAAFQPMLTAIGETTESGDLLRLAGATTALAVRLDASQAERLIAGCLKGIAGTTDQDQIRAFLNTATALAGRLTADNSQALFALVVKAITESDDVDQLSALGTIGSALARTWTPAQSQRQLEALAEAVTAGTDAGKLRALGALGRALSSHLTSDQAHPIFLRMLKAAMETQDSDQLEAFGAIGEGAAAKLTSQQAQSQFSAVIKSMLGSSNESEIQALSGIARELANVLTPPQRADVLPLVLQGLARPTAQRFPSTLGPVVEVLVANVTPDQIQTVFPAILRAIGAGAVGPPARASRASSAARARTRAADRKRTMSMAATLADKFNADQARAILPGLVQAIESTTDANETLLLGIAGKSFGDKLSDGPAAALLPTVLTAMSRATDTDQLNALQQCAGALAGKLTPAQARSALSGVLKSITSLTDSDQLQALASTAETLATRETSVSPALLPNVLAEIARTNDPDRVAAFGLVARSFAEAMTPDQAQAAFSPVLTSISTTIDPDPLTKLSRAAETLALKISEGHARAAYAMVLKSIENATDPDQLEALGVTAQALTTRLSSEEAETGFRSIAIAISRNDDTDRLDALGKTAQALGAKLTEEQVQPALELLLMSAGTVRSDDQLKALGLAAGGLASRARPEQAHAALKQLLLAIKGTTEPETLDALGGAARALAVRLTAKDAESELPALLRDLARASDKDQREALAATLLAMPGQTETLIALGVLAGGAESDDELETVGAMFDAFTKEWKPEQVERALMSFLAWSGGPDEASLWSKALVAELPKQPAERSVRVLVEALKFPSAVGNASGTLLDGLRSIAPAAPGKDAGLDANLAWIATTYPAIDLDAPPACPAPPGPDLACPAVEQ